MDQIDIPIFENNNNKFLLDLNTNYKEEIKLFSQKIDINSSD
jgi:hypothetical protein